MNHYRVLIIEDEPEVRRLLVELLQSYREAHFECLEEGRLEAGIGILRGNGIDAVVLDLRLPDSYGLDAVARVRQVSEDVAVIVLSGFLTLEDALRAIRLGADDCKAKPFYGDDRVAWSIILSVARRRRFVKAKQELRRTTIDLEKFERARRWALWAKIIAGITTFAGVLLTLLRWILKK